MNVTAVRREFMEQFAKLIALSSKGNARYYWSVMDEGKASSCDFLSVEYSDLVMIYKRCGILNGRGIVKEHLEFFIEVLKAGNVNADYETCRISLPHKGTGRREKFIGLGSFDSSHGYHKAQDQICNTQMIHFPEITHKTKLSDDDRAEQQNIVTCNDSNNLLLLCFLVI